MDAARRNGAGRARPQRRAHGGGIGEAGGRRDRQGQSRAVGRRRSVRGRDRRSRQGRRQSRRTVRGPAFPDEGSRPDDEGPPAGNGLADHARQSRDIRYVPDREISPGRPQPHGANDDAGVRGLQFGGKSRRLCHAQSLEHRLHHLRLVRRQRRDGRGRRGPDRACDRRRRFDPHSGRRQRQYRAEGVARGVLARACSCPT